VNEHDTKFEQLYRDHYRSTVRFFVAKGFTLEEARELAQDVFASVYTHMSGFRGDASAKTWILSIARNRCANEFRHWSSRGGLHRTESLSAGDGLDDDERPGRQPSSGEPRADEALVEDEQVRLLWAAIAELPSQQRCCLLLRIVDELKYREIAAVMNISMATVKSLLHEAKEKLKQKLGTSPPGFDEPDDGGANP
jgi:RNA polymerase sigma-70 factor, ECF subfamily